jgi:hypothetical protein
MTKAVLFDFNRQDCQLSPLPSLLAQSNRPIMDVTVLESLHVQRLDGILMGSALRFSTFHGLDTDLGAS